MLISHRKKFIYTKTEKTAGTSVESYFEKFCMAEGQWEFSHGREEHVSEEGIIGYRGKKSDRGNVAWYSHLSARNIQKSIGNDVWNSYYKFCVIRNPYDKALSYFFRDSQRKKMDGQTASNDSSKSSDESVIGEFRSYVKKKYDSFVKNLLIPKWKRFDRDKYVINGKVCVDYFIRYEELDEGIKHVCQKLDVPFEADNIPKLKSGFRNTDITMREFYDEKTEAIIKKAFDFEIKYFGYTITD